VVKMRTDGRVENRAVYVAIGVTLAGQKEVLGLWSSANEGAKFWLQVLTEMQNRGLKDIFIACVDGLKGFPQAIETVYPKTTVQLCIVHMVRASLNYVNWKERKRVAQDLKAIYRAATVEEAERQLAEFAAQWDPWYPSISALWRRNWQGVIPFFQFPPEIRKIVYTTNAIESLNMSLRKAIKMRGAFPSEDAALKVMYLALRSEIKSLWSAHQISKATAKHTKQEVKTLRLDLGRKLCEMKSILARTGRSGGWSAYLRSYDLPRASAERYIDQHEALLKPKQIDSRETVSETDADDVRRLVRSLLPRLRRILTTPEWVARFLEEVAFQWEPADASPTAGKVDEVGAVAKADSGSQSEAEAAPLTQAA
jgi:hypothetical protein